jgi:hypothetical protein
MAQAAAGTFEPSDVAENDAAREHRNDLERVRDRRVEWIGLFTFSGYTQSAVTKVTESRSTRTAIADTDDSGRGMVAKADFTGSGRTASLPRQ